MSADREAVEAAERSGFEAGRLAERKSFIAWIRYLMTANRDPRAREDLLRVLATGGSTLGSVRQAVERGDHLLPRQ